ncbi:hypothetical protein AAMO2058_001326900 [Amorphochlora amoebiformis]
MNKPTKYSLALLSNDKSQSGHSGGTLGLSLLHLLKKHNRQQTVIYVFEWKQAKHSSLVSEVQNDQHVVHAARALLSKIFAEPSPAEEPSELCALPKPTSETDKLEIAAIQEQALPKERLRLSIAECPSPISRDVSYVSSLSHGKKSRRTTISKPAKYGFSSNQHRRPLLLDRGSLGCEALNICPKTLKQPWSSRDHLHVRTLNVKAQPCLLEVPTEGADQNSKCSMSPTAKKATLNSRPKIYNSALRNAGNRMLSRIDPTKSTIYVSLPHVGGCNPMAA